MATLREDLIEGSIVETDGQVVRAVRVFHVEGIEVNPLQPYETLWTAQNVPGVPRYGDKHPSRSHLIVANIHVMGTSGTSAKLAVRYESSQWGGEPSSYIITDDGYTEKYLTTYVPGTRRLITVTAQIEVDVPQAIPGASSVQTVRQTQLIGPEPVTFLFDRHIRTITVHRLIYGSLQPDKGFDGPYTGYKPMIGQKLVGQVNKGKWMDDPQGFWKLQKFRTDVSRYSGYYTKVVSAATKNDEDWSEFGFLRSKMTGNFISPDENAFNQVAALPYDYGIIGENISKGKGFARVGPGKLLDFKTIFEF